jgi:hypothetical protein
MEISSRIKDVKGQKRVRGAVKYDEISPSGGLELLVEDLFDKQHQRDLFSGYLTFNTKRKAWLEQKCNVHIQKGKTKKLNKAVIQVFKLGTSQVSFMETADLQPVVGDDLYLIHCIYMLNVTKRHICLTVACAITPFVFPLHISITVTLSSEDIQYGTFSVNSLEDIPTVGYKLTTNIRP